MSWERKPPSSLQDGARNLGSSLMAASSAPPTPVGAASATAAVEKQQKQRSLQFISSCLLHIDGHAGTASISGSLLPASKAAAEVVWKPASMLYSVGDMTPDASVAEEQGDSTWVITGTQDSQIQHT